jgi:predicted nucleic acid-binding protein
MPSARAADDRLYERLGLADAAIAAVARAHNCCVLTDDFDLFIALGRDGVPALNFAHLREQAWGV